MINALGLFIAVIAGTCKSFGLKKANKFAAPVHSGDAMLSNFIMAAVSFIVILILSGFRFGKFSAFTFGLAVVFAAGNVVAQFIYIRLLATGPISLGILFSSAGFMVPTLFGTVFWQEKISQTQYIGLFILLCALILVTYRKSAEPDNKANMRWIILAICCTLAMGTIGVFQKVQQRSDFKDEINEFLLIFTALYTLTAFVLYLFSSDKRKFRIDPFIKWTVFAGLGYGIVSKLNLYLCGVLESIIIFPVYNGGILITGALTGIIILREQIRKVQYAGLALALIAIILLSGIV